MQITELSLDEAYAVQDAVAALRVEQGEAIAGYKVGCTSEAIRWQFGIREPIMGRLFASHLRSASATPVVFWDDYAGCAIEPELVLRIGKDLEGENVSDLELIDAIESVSAGLELHHFHFWFGPPSIQELICSNGIHAALIVGDGCVAPSGLSFRGESFEVRCQGELVARGLASEIMGGPLDSLRWLVRFLTRKRERLQAGSVVIPGSPVELIRIEADSTVSVSIENVGGLTTHFQIRPIP